ncbi:Integrase [Ruminococcaceae bacterium FB2012]|nr:Integrase [Ruminococcaceae bacterium FB2012]
MRKQSPKDKKKPSKSDMTFQELFDIWIAVKAEELQPSTIQRYTSDYRMYVKAPFGDRKINDITPDNWQRFEEQMSTVKGSFGKELLPSTVRKITTFARKLFMFGKTNYDLNDPTEEIQAAKKAVASKTFFDSDEIEKMKVAVKPYNVFQLCIMLCIYVGASQGEICGLKWGDIDTDNQQLTIQRSVARERITKRSKETVIMVYPKAAGSIRIHPFPDWINDQLKLMKRIHTDEEFLIQGKNGTMEPSSFVNNYYCVFLNKANVEYRSFTALKNTFARKCIDEGMSVEELSSLFGDWSIEYTKRKRFGLE